jgi:hypothetical protein
MAAFWGGRQIGPILVSCRPAGSRPAAPMQEAERELRGLCGGIGPGQSGNCLRSREPRAAQ